jgi:hypothetical protein
MGITIAYRGRLADLARIEDFEDRLLDFALEVGGLAQIWRTHADDDPQRVVRGIILNLAPGQETASLLVSPEGWLIGLTDIKDAEDNRLTEPPWCFVKTLFGPLEGHVALVEMLTALQREFLADLEVHDEGGYWETRDVAELARRRSALQEAIEGLAAGLQRHGLSSEAAEDPEILLRHIERIAAQVHRTLKRPSEHPPVTFPDGGEFAAPDPDETETLWDEMFKHNRRQQERLQRALEERASRGEDDEPAFEESLRDLGLEVPGDEPEATDEPWRRDEPEEFAGGSDEFEPDRTEPENGGDGEDPFGEERHPLLQRATHLLMRLHAAFDTEDSRLTPSLHTLFHGAGDAVGGLAQALSDRWEDRDLDSYGLCLVQLKRALRGAAFARGAMFTLRSAVPNEQWHELQDALEQFGHDIYHEIARLRSEHQQDEPGS